MLWDHTSLSHLSVSFNFDGRRRRKKVWKDNKISYKSHRCLSSQKWGWLAKRDLNWGPHHTKEWSKKCKEAAKDKATKIVYSSLYLAFTPNNVLGDSHYTNKTSTLLSKYKWAKINLFSHNNHFRVDVEPWLWRQSFGNGQVIWKGQSPSSSLFPWNPETFVVV